MCSLGRKRIWVSMVRTFTLFNLHNITTVYYRLGVSVKLLCLCNHHRIEQT